MCEFCGSGPNCVVCGREEMVYTYFSHDLDHELAFIFLSDRYPRMHTSILSDWENVWKHWNLWGFVWSRRVVDKPGMKITQNITHNFSNHPSPLSICLSLLYSLSLSRKVELKGRSKCICGLRLGKLISPININDFPCLFFSAHRLTGSFLDYWNGHHHFSTPGFELSIKVLNPY